MRVRLLAALGLMVSQAGLLMLACGVGMAVVYDVDLVANDDARMGRCSRILWKVLMEVGLLAIVHL